jgi:predicted nucleotidyltransferase
MRLDVVGYLRKNSYIFQGLEGLIAVYLYGSMISGRLRKESDIDIAILPSYRTTTDERLELISKVEGCVSDLIGRISIKRDISVLDLRGKYVSLTLQYKIITEGILLHETDKDERLEFENAVKGEYFDFALYLRSLRQRRYGDISQKV